MNCLQGKAEEGRRCLQTPAGVDGLGWSIPSPPPESLCGLPTRWRGEKEGQPGVIRRYHKPDSSIRKDAHKFQ